MQEAFNKSKHVTNHGPEHNIGYQDSLHKFRAPEKYLFICYSTMLREDIKKKTADLVKTALLGGRGQKN